MSRKQLSTIWWFLTGTSLAIGAIGFRDVVGWLEASKQLDNEQVAAVVSFWSVLLSGLLLTLGNLVGVFVSGRAWRRPWQERIPEWPLGFLTDEEAENVKRWDWKLFKACGFGAGAIAPWLLVLWHFLKLAEAKVVDNGGLMCGSFFRVAEACGDDLRIGAEAGDSYIPFLTPGTAILVFVLSTLSLFWFVARVLRGKVQRVS